MTNDSRRDFLKIVTNGLLSGSGLLGVGGLLHYLNYSSQSQPKTEFALGSASDFPLGSRTLLNNVPAILIHDENGFVAYDLICPHLGCTVVEEVDKFICPCHGSQFNLEGDVQRGPALESLRTLRVELSEDEQLYLYTT